MPESNRSVEQTRTLVRDQYEKFPYPKAEPSLDAFIASGASTLGCPSSFYEWYWPYQAPRADLDILVAGCGTMQAVKLGLRMPAARITAIDLSHTSIAHTQRLAAQHQVSNIDTRQLPIEEAGSLGRQFDLIISTGVLHHLPDPDRGLAVLRECLRVEGSMYLMVYAQYGRTGVYQLQDMFRRMGLSSAAADQDTINDIMQLIRSLPPTHPVTTMQQYGRFDNNEEIVDLFLHSQDRAYTLPQVYDWLHGAGLRMQKLVMRGNYAPACSNLVNTALYPRIQSLPLAEQFAIGELYRAAISMHFFVACRDDRDEASYRIDLDRDDWQRLVPVRNTAVEYSRDNVPAGRVVWAFWRMHQFRNIRYALDAQQLQWLELADGRRSLGDILTLHQSDAEALRQFFALMEDYDYLWFKGPGAQASA